MLLGIKKCVVGSKFRKTMGFFEILQIRTWQAEKGKRQSYTLNLHALHFLIFSQAMEPASHSLLVAPMPSAVFAR